MPESLTSDRFSGTSELKTNKQTNKQILWSSLGALFQHSGFPPSFISQLINELTINMTPTLSEFTLIIADLSLHTIKLNWCVSHDSSPTASNAYALETLWVNLDWKKEPYRVIVALVVVIIRREIKRFNVFFIIIIVITTTTTATTSSTIFVIRRGDIKPNHTR